MGKLHTLKRAIHRTPQAFMIEGPAFVQDKITLDIRFTGMKLYSLGAQVRDGQWQPVVLSDQKRKFPYRRFVRTTLRTMGYEIAL